MSFEDSPGWAEEDKARVEELRARRLQLVGVVYAHEYWAQADPGRGVAARSALKRIDGPEEQPDDGA